MKRKRKRFASLDSGKGTLLFSYIIMGALSLLAILPFFNIISKAVSSGAEVTAGNIYFLPKGFQLETIKYVLMETDFLNSLKNSLIVTGLGTLISIFATVTTAYPLSKRDMPGRKLVSMLYVVSMVFFGGMVPAYMVVRSLGLIDTYAACILPFAIVQFNMFVVKSYFEGIPESVEEAARIDGAGDIKVLVKIVCPMAKPVLATVGLLYAITYWNNYFHVMMYTKTSSMQTLQIYLYNLINNTSSIADNVVSGTSAINLTSEGMLASAVTLSIIPMMILYPFVSRHLVNGISVGSVKG